MTITPRVGVSGIEFVRSREGSEEREIVSVPLDVCEYLVSLGAHFAGEQTECIDGRWWFRPEAVLTMLRQDAILRQEAEK